jgi:hypothetical protein
VALHIPGSAATKGSVRIINLQDQQRIRRISGSAHTTIISNKGISEAYKASGSTEDQRDQWLSTYQVSAATKKDQ